MIIRLAICQMLFNAIYQFSNLFMNTYLFRLHHEVRTVAYYNLTLFIFWIFMFYIGFRLCEKNTRVGLRISGICCLTGILCLLSGINHPLLGAFIGSSGGFFWASYLSIYRMLGKQSEQGSTFARVSLMSSFVSVLVPILFGHLVQGAGYVAGFAVLCCLSVGIVLMSFLFPVYQTDPVFLRLKSFAHPQFVGANSLIGFYFSFIGIASGLMVFMAGQGEANVGMYATLYGLLTVLVNLLVAYLLPERNQKWGLLIACILYMFTSLLFYIQWDQRVILYNFLIAGLGPLFNNPIVGINFGYINASYQNWAEGLVVRELGLTIGRLLFFTYLAVVGIQAQSLVFSVFLSIVSVFPIFVYILFGTSSQAAKVKQMEAAAR